MNEPRKHHIIPKMILRRFVNGDGKLFVFDKRRPKSGVYPISPAKAFTEKDLNSVKQADGTLDAQLEIGFSKLESEVSPIIDRIVDRALSGKKPALNSVQLNHWNNFVSYQQKRSPDVFERLGITQTYPDDLSGFIDEFERDFRPLTHQERKNVFSPEMLQNVVVTARGTNEGLVLEALARRGLAIAILDSPKRSFIIGDYPLARLGRNSLNHPQCELWFPISSKVAISPWGEANSETVIVLNREQVRRLNNVIWGQSNIIAGRSNRLVRSLAGL